MKVQHLNHSLHEDIRVRTQAVFVVKQISKVFLNNSEMRLLEYM